MNHDLRRMAVAVKKLRIAYAFPRIHHFSRQDVFRTPALTLAHFEAYAKRKVNSFLPDGENVRTVSRALAVVASVERGESLEKAIGDAWNEYPLVKRQRAGAGHGRR
jgi:hypothetical protein